MFESYLTDLLVPYLGHFLDISPESLRVSLFSGERRGENAPFCVVDVTS